MAIVDKLIEHFRQRRAQILDDIQRWRDGGWKLRKNNEDITEDWLTEQQRRADELGSIIADYEKRNA
jgi:hypothetical protein